MNTATETIAAAVFASISIPPIGDNWPNQGGTFEALMKGENGQPDYALILHTEHHDDDTWPNQKAWAGSVEKDGHKDFSLPTRAELNALCANAKDKFNDDWYWSSEPYGSDYAWCQDFLSGYQDWGHQVSNLRACAVRRVPIR